jgi:hypothetical protein
MQAGSHRGGADRQHRGSMKAGSHGASDRRMGAAGRQDVMVQKTYSIGVACRQAVTEQQTGSMGEHEGRQSQSNRQAA